ncbi:MAG: membrane-bound lytic murein transglycosylase MltF [Gammaproteobacteria bacterium]|nr:membrane-bound lytic murein transglycosylase MltF [Gammaproteobacteria bacterium]
MRAMKSGLLPTLTGLLLSLLLTACSDSEQSSGGHTAQPPAELQPLRILRPRKVEGVGYLPRQGLPQTEELALLERFARQHGMSPEYVYADGYDELIPRLLAGEADIIAANLTVTASRKQQIHFTTPIAYVREQIIARNGEAPEDAHDLAGRSVAVHAADSYHETLQTLLGQRFQPPFTIQLVDESIPTEVILRGVAQGRYDLAVADSNLADVVLGYHDDLQVAFSLGSVRSIAWAIHPNNSSLLTQLNDFLGKHHLASDEKQLHRDDLKKIKERKVLRLLTRNNAATYFLWRGELLGFEYELARRFAKEHDLRLEVIVPPGRDALIPWLKEGRGDLIAASLTVTPEREAQGVTFSRPYHHVSEIVVTRSDDNSLQSLQDLTGRTIVVRRSSAYWQSLQALQQEGIEFVLQAAPEQLETEELINRVASGEYDLTVADSHILDIELTWREDIQAAFPLGEPRPHGWAVRKENRQLLAAIDRFLEKEYRGLFYNITYKKYFKDPKRILSHVEQRVDSASAGALSPYDELAQKYARRYGLDWRLVISQMFQESRFDATARSWAGALGLMQVLPRTGRELGLENLRDPETGLHAGVKYLHWLMRRFEPELPIAERTWFALAAYNAGIGHVRDARRLARELGHDPDRWFDNVEQAMLLLATQRHARKARHGYVRGHEPVNYVRQIRNRYLAYIKLKQRDTPAQVSRNDVTHLMPNPAVGRKATSAPAGGSPKPR